MKFGKKEAKVLLICGSVLLTALYVWFVFIPQNAAMEKLNKDYKDNTLLSTRVLGIDMRLKVINEEVEKIEKDITSKKSKVSKTLRVPDILTELDKQAYTYSVTIDEVEFTGDASPVKGKEIQPQTALDPLAVLATGAEASGAPPAVVADPTQADTLATTPTLSSLTLEFSFLGSYENVMKLIKYYENNPRLFVIKLVDIQNTEKGSEGKIELQAFSIDIEKEDFLY